VGRGGESELGCWGKNTWGKHNTTPLALSVKGGGQVHENVGGKLSFQGAVSRACVGSLRKGS